MRFAHPEPYVQSPPVFPVFIPFAGCPRRCVFCAQELQTGTALKPTAQVLSEIREHFARLEEGSGLDLAFYGGTFTALPVEEQEAYLALAQELKAQGKVREVRCSTRPDNVSGKQLEWLRGLGLDCIELGVQSFCSSPLEASRRNYSGSDAYNACLRVQLSGLSLGIQLMPGMPGMRPEQFKEDIKICLDLKPDVVRLYPCLVLEGTILAEEWRMGKYSPWSLDTVLDVLPMAVLLLWRRGIRVIRLGLAPEQGLTENILDGPYHPALGQRLRSEAIFLYLQSKLKENQFNIPPHFTLYAPARVQGEFYGHKGELKASYAKLGLHPGNVRWWENDFFELVPE